MDKASYMKDGLTFRFAVATDFPAVLELASQLAIQIEAPIPPLTAAQFETYYVSAHAPMHLLLAVQGNRIVGMISWTLTHELLDRQGPGRTTAKFHRLAVITSTRKQVRYASLASRHPDSADHLDRR